MKKLICAALIAGAVGGAAKAADLPTAKPTEAEPTTPSCFDVVSPPICILTSRSQPVRAAIQPSEPNLRLDFFRSPN
jgi:hypothetical protein